MKAVEAKLLSFLKKSFQFTIPIYQRTYSWTEKECHQLWDDVLRAGRNDSISAHFIGSIVYIEGGLSTIMSQSPLLVIDGQQRLTTISILLAVLAKALGDAEPLEGFSARKLRHYYLLNPEEDGDQRYKLILTQTDAESLKAVVDDREQPREQSLRVIRNFELFTNWVTGCQDLLHLCKGLAKLVVVDIALSRDHDNPQLIFESMNSTGKELSQADLIRNFVLMGLEPKVQIQLYTQYWRPMELDFGQEAYGTHFDDFMRHYLTVRTGQIPNVDQVYEAFKVYARSAEISTAGVEELVKQIREFARYFCAMALGAENDPELKAAFQDLRELRVDVAYPFLLEIYHDYKCGLLGGQDFMAAVQLTEGYVFRRSVCAIPTNSMNKTFATFSKAIRKGQYLESIAAIFQLLPSYRRFPDDAEFRRELEKRDLYHFRNRSYWLRKLENHGRKERVIVDQYTVEHILPQCDNEPEKVPVEWRTELGSEWQRIWTDLRHTLGNLTLTGYNSEYSNKSFQTKRDMQGGFRESPLKVNTGLGQVEHWNEAEIKKRAERLSQVAAEVWTSPKLPIETVARYKPVRDALPVYTIDNHPHLLSPAMRPLYEAFRKEVLALDPCVTEEFLKLYVAYKAETNFVDIVPQAKRLRLMINMPFPDINDPKGLCKDVTDKGRWGNGDVELGVSSLDDLPYAIGIVRQSFERQMGNGAEA